jgi:hypothetical protein
MFLDRAQIILLEAQHPSLVERIMPLVIVLDKTPSPPHR